MSKKPDPYKLDKAEGDYEWTAKDFLAAKPLAELMPDFADNMAALAKKIGRPPKAERKELLSIRIDPDLVAILRRDVPKYQTRLNALVRDAIKKRSKILFGEQT